MALRSQSPGTPADTPSEAWLLCAACGPLSEAQAQHGGVSLLGEPGLAGTPRRYEVAAPLPFPELRRHVLAAPAVQEAVSQVESARRKASARERSLTHEEMAGSARAALLLGKGKEFKRLYAEYIRENGWHPDHEHFAFWDAVLGPGWHGSEVVPEGAARDEIVGMTTEAFAFFAMPEGAARGKGAGGARDGMEWAEVAAALRTADAGALAGLVDEDSIALAAADMLRGCVAEAHRTFERHLGRSETGRYFIIRLRGLPLLVYALLNGVAAGGSPRYLRAWFSAARFALPYVFPPSMAREEAELNRFLDHLEQVDDIVNRNGAPVFPLRVEGGLSGLPYAIFYGSLPFYVRESLSLDKLVDAVEITARNGLTLLARWGASGLLNAAVLSEELRARLAPLRGEPSAAPRLPLPRTERVLAALREAVQKEVRRGSSLSRGQYALPPTFAASRIPSGVVISMQTEEDVEECDDSAALRCMCRYADREQLVLEGASPAEFTRLFVSMEAHVEVAGSLALQGEVVESAAPQPVLLFAHEGGERTWVALRLRVLPGALPLMTPRSGLEIPVLEREDGRSVAVRREFEREWLLVEETLRRLQQAGFEKAECLLYGSMQLETFAELASLLRACRELALETCWEQGYALRLHLPSAPLQLRRGEGKGDWLTLGGGLPVDEERVIELSSLLDAFASRKGKLLQLADGEYVLLNPSLERQLALLELICREKKGERGVAASAIPLLDALEKAPAMDAEPSQPPVVPGELRAELRPYQAAGFSWLAERVRMGVGALLADDMGLGKTVQVLALMLHAAARAGAGPALVLAPVSLLGNWAEEAARFAPALRVIVYDPRTQHPLGALAGGSLVLASYGQLVARPREFAAVGWDVLVLDEAQAVKNPDSQRARAVCSLTARARLCLTGTPIENSLIDLWSLMRFLNPGLFGTRAAFQRRFKKAKPAELELLRQVLAPLVLRRTKAEVLTQLPPLTEMVEWVEFSHEERALYESLRRAAIGKLGAGEHRVSILAELTRLRRACCHGKLALAAFEGDSSKLALMVARVEELRAAGHRVLVFSQFTDVLDLAQERLQAADIRCLRLDGRTPAAQRTHLVREFRQGGADAFLISLKAGGAGLNLTEADYVLLLDPWWNPAAEAQAAGRSHRMGQQHPVTLCRFMVRDTVEERIADMHRDKKELAEQVLSGKAEGMSLANLRALLG